MYNVSTTNHSYQIIKKDTLKLDLYQPEDFNGQTPLLIFVHGGGFASGKRDDEHIVKFCKTIAQYGFSVASISYRLSMKKTGFGCNVKAKDKLKAFNMAAEDISYAIEYIADKKNNFNIDTEKVIVSGVSSGAEAILHLVYNFKNKILSNDIKFAGAISFSGALASLKHINDKITVPTLLFHGTNDNLVPYFISAHHFCKEDEPGYLQLYGSRAIANRLKGLDKSYYLVSFIGAPHHHSSNPMHYQIEEILDFLMHDVLGNMKRQTERIYQF